jgi:hypothetical protein
MESRTSLVVNMRRMLRDVYLLVAIVNRATAERLVRPANGQVMPLPPNGACPACFKHNYVHSFVRWMWESPSDWYCICDECLEEMAFK